MDVIVGLLKRFKWLGEWEKLGCEGGDDCVFVDCCVLEYVFVWDIFFFILICWCFDGVLMIV